MGACLWAPGRYASLSVVKIAGQVWRNSSRRNDFSLPVFTSAGVPLAGPAVSNLALRDTLTGRLAA
jgi:hypothetical protein